MMFYCYFLNFFYVTYQLLFSRFKKVPDIFNDEIFKETRQGSRAVKLMVKPSVEYNTIA